MKALGVKWRDLFDLDAVSDRPSASRTVPESLVSRRRPLTLRHRKPTQTENIANGHVEPKASVNHSAPSL